MDDRHPTVAVVLRRAQPADQARITGMVRQARLDRSALHWSHFLVAELADAGTPAPERVIGIGQIRPYRHCPELGSLYVLPPYRRQGVAAQLVRALLASHPAPIYLECLQSTMAFYRRFGFQEIAWYHAPWPLWLKSGVGTLGSKVGLTGGQRVVTMRWDG